MVKEVAIVIEKQENLGRRTCNINFSILLLYDKFAHYQGKYTFWVDSSPLSPFSGFPLGWFC